jgi:hypothetical protein
LNRITLMPTVDYLNVFHLWYIFERLKAYIYLPVIQTWLCIQVFWDMTPYLTVVKWLFTTRLSITSQKTWIFKMPAVNSSACQLCTVPQYYLQSDDMVWGPCHGLGC